MSSPSANDSNHNDDDNGPLPLSELKRWMSEDVYQWIKEGDEKQERLEKELEENAHMRLFGEVGSDSEDEDDEHDTNDTVDKTEKKKKQRIRKWSSSLTSSDGVGGFHSSTDSSYQSCQNGDDGAIQIVYILSDSYEGFGDVLWSSARYVANTISNPNQCLELLSPLQLTTGNGNHHPLHGRSFLEVGAGAGVPSWAALKCGANIVCTDLSDTNRIRSMAECVEQNVRQIVANDETDVLTEASRARVCPHDWGSSTEGVLRALHSSSDDQKESQRLFDVIIAADCCYMPWWHKELLESIYNLLSDKGVAIIAWALHGNTDDQDVMKIVDRARDRGFVVEVLDSQQLTPPKAGMEAKQGLVHIARLTKPL